MSTTVIVLAIIACIEVGVVIYLLVQIMKHDGIIK